MFVSPTPTTNITLPSAEIDNINNDVRSAAWNKLVTRYGESRLRRHSWEWNNSTGEWLPYYTYQPVSGITDVWTEWSAGLGGYLSVRELTKGWGPRWRRNVSGQKTEHARRKKIVDMVAQLSQKHLWDVALALRFLRDCYELTKPLRFKTTRAFCDFLQKRDGSGWAEVVQASNSYT